MVDPLHPKLNNFGDKHRDYYKFSHYLVNEGDFIVTDTIKTFKERREFVIDALWWASRNNKVIKTETIWQPATETDPAGKAIKVTLTRNYRHK